MHIVSPQQLYTLANAVIGVAMMTVTAAVAFSARRKRPQFPMLTALIALFFFIIGISRLVRAFTNTNAPGALEILMDCAGGITALATAAVIWPTALATLNKPSYDELDHAKAELEIANRRLLEAEALFALFTEHLPGLAFIRDKDGLVVFANEHCRQEYQVEIGKPIDWLPEDAQERIAATDRRVLARREVVQEVETLPTMLSGEKSWLTTKFPLVRSDGTTVVGGISLDVSELLAAQEANTELSLQLQAMEQTKRFRDLAQALPHLVFTTDAQGNCDFASNQLLEYAGVATEDVLNQGVWDLVHPADMESQRGAWQSAMQNQAEFQSEIRWRAADGTYRWHLIRVVPIRDLSGKVTSFLGSATDIEDQKRASGMLEQHAKEREARLAALVESSQDAIIGKSIDGIITSWNKGAERLYGYTADEILGQPISLLMPEDKKHELDESLVQLRLGNSVEPFETIRHSKNGAEIHVSVTISPVRDFRGRVVGASVIARDITQQKKAQKQIQTLNEELKERINQLAESNAALQIARDQALEASNLKSAFVANISHELRTPLSGIMGMNELVLMAPELSDETKSLAETVQESAIALLGVVNDILDLSKIEAGKVSLEYEPFNPKFMVQDCTNLLASAARGKGLAFTLQVDQHMPQFIYGDSARVRQVLLNLIGNAIKFTDKGKVSVSTHLVQQQDDQATLRFEVSDTGIGIAKESQRFLFLPFSQADNSSTRKFGGTGLGLTISKRFVEMMGGTIGFDSTVGTGSTFWFEVRFDTKPSRDAKSSVVTFIPPSSPVQRQDERT